MNYIIRALLTILSIPALSRMYGWLTRRQNPRFLIKRLIPFFAKTYNIGMDEYMGDYSDYYSLNEFFIRKFDREKRKFKNLPDSLVSPADGFLTSLNIIYEDQATQAKGRYYKISEFIQDDIDFSEGWCIATIYLSPHNYHRYHHTATAEIDSYLHKSERVITKYNLNKQPFYVVAVGATFVGSIKMEFVEQIKRDNKWKTVGTKINQLDEMGRFEMGSTIIMVIPKNLATPIADITGKKIKKTLKLVEKTAMIFR